MSEICYTLLAEGTSDKALIPILSWLLRSHLSAYEIQSTWADLSRLPSPPKSLTEKIRTSIDLYPCDILFVHRDADNQGIDQRNDEIDKAIALLDESFQFPVIRTIPITMTEAWLLFDEYAIRTAASNPKGRVPLNLPSLGQVENIADPKALLNERLKLASGCTGRRLKKFRTSEKIQRISELIEDFSPLRQLSAFQALEAQVKAFAAHQ